MKRAIVILLALFMLGNSLMFLSCGQETVHPEETEAETETTLEETAETTYETHKGEGFTVAPPASRDTEAVETKPLPSGTKINIIPNCEWGKKNQNNAAKITIGDGVYSMPFDTVDISEYKYVEFDLYVPDATAIIEKSLTVATQFEITSSGQPDQEEMCWGATTFFDGLDIQDGWNHIRKEIPASAQGLNKAKTNFIRWYWVEPTVSIPNCQICNLRFTTDNSVEPA